MNDDFDYVPVSVPRPLMPQVTGLINEFLSGPTPAGQTATAQTPIPKAATTDDDTTYSVAGQGNYTRTEIEALLDWHNDDALTLLRIVAERSLGGEDTNWGQLQELSGLSNGQTRSNLAVMSKRAIKLFNEKKWPIVCVDHGPGAPSAGRYVYSAPDDIAKAILDILDA